MDVSTWRQSGFHSGVQCANSFESLVESLQNIKCPSFQPSEGSFSKPERLLPDNRVQVLLNDIASVTWEDISQSVSKCQWLDESLGLEARDWLWWHKFCGGIWDKKAHRNYAVCRVLDDIRMCVTMMEFCLANGSHLRDGALHHGMPRPQHSYSCSIQPMSAGSWATWTPSADCHQTSHPKTSHNG